MKNFEKNNNSNVSVNNFDVKANAVNVVNLEEKIKKFVGVKTDNLNVFTDNCRVLLKSLCKQKNYKFYPDFEFEDFFQICMLKVFSSVDSYDSKYLFTTYYYKICVNTYITEIKKSTNAKMITVSEAKSEDDNTTDIFEILEVNGSALGAEEKYFENDAKIIIRELVDNLSEDHRDAIDYKYYQGLTSNEIATIMDSNKNTVDTWLSRARNKLGKEITNRNIKDDLFREFE